VGVGVVGLGPRVGHAEATGSGVAAAAAFVVVAAGATARIPSRATAAVLTAAAL